VVNAECKRDQDCAQPGLCYPNCRCGKYHDDPIQDWIDSVSNNNPTFVAGQLDIIEYNGVLYQVNPETKTEIFDKEYPCSGSQSGAKVVCGDLVLANALNILVATMVMVDAVVIDDTFHSYIYSLALDSDGSSTNNWKWVPPYDYDIYQGTDLWYQLIGDHTTQTWSLVAKKVDDAQQVTTVQTAARAVIEGPKITFYVPMDELPAPVPGFRVTTFGHDGNYSVSDRGADVSGKDPTEALATPEVQQ